MHLRALVILSILLLNIAQIQSYSCKCSCCLGSGCQPLTRDPVEASQCTDASCLAACKARYYECNVTPPYGQSIGQCQTTTTSTASPGTDGPYSCQCLCCNTGSYQCTPSFVGYTNAYACQVGACSISCTKKYPNVCVNNQFGQTHSTCVGMTTLAPVGPGGSLRCGCVCYGSSGTQNYEVVTTNGCSGCLNACRSIQLQCSSHQNTYCTS